jgi:hypothetical protein
MTVVSVFRRERHPDVALEAVSTGTDAAASSLMSAMTTAAADFDHLDAELARWLRARTTLRATRDRDDSPLDAVAMTLRKLRATLSFTASHGASNDASVVAVVARTYRWSIRMARELDTIEQLALDPLAEWTRFEAFAPFALAFFDSLLAAPLCDATTSTDVARVRRDVDAVLAPLAIAMTSSAMAA